MTSPKSTIPLSLPISSLLPPQSSAPNDGLPIPLSLLGPLPPTTPIHLALNHLYLSSLPEFETGSQSVRSSESIKRNRERVLIITGPKEEYASNVEVEDEDYMRERGGDYGILDRLRRVDIRYCPTIKHVMLLLSLLSRQADADTGPQNLDKRPGLVILWNIAGLLMEVNEANENIQDQDNTVEVGEPRLKFKAGVIISDYLEVIAAAKSAVHHLSSLNAGSPPVGLLILEPELSPDSSLPIFTPDGISDEIPKQSREKRIKLQIGLERILGRSSSGSIVPAHVDEESAVYTLCLPGGTEGYSMRRRRCPRGAWGSAAFEGRMKVDVDGLPAAEGDPGGWRWEWT